MLDKILYTDSGAGNTQEMLQVLMELPSLGSAQISVLHVVSQQITKEAETEKWEEGGRILAKVIQSLKLDPTQVSTVLRQGEPKDTVCRVAEEINADLIVMGSRGLKRLEAILGNSVSQYVFQLTNRPMLLVRDDIYVKKIKRVMVALDKSEAAFYGLELALHLVRGHACELILARVNPDLDPAFDSTSPADTESNPVLASAIERVKRAGVAYRSILKGGRPGKQLCQIAEDYNADLLVLGSPDRRPSVAKSLPDLDRLLGTSLSDYVRVNANCPVLLARTDKA